MDERKKQKRGKTIRRVVIFAVIAAVIIGFNRARANRAGEEAPPQTAALEKTDLTKTLSVSGTVRSADTQNVYSTQSYPVREICVKVGDYVQEGDILAYLDTSRLESDIQTAEINLKSARNAVAEEQRAARNSVANAETSLDASRISLERQRISTANAEKDLEEAEKSLEEPFDSYAADRAIDDAYLNYERRLQDLAQAEADLDTALNDFDGYALQNIINEAKITFDRRRADLAKARADLAAETEAEADVFDDYAFQNAVSDAERNLQRRRDDERDAENRYFDAMYNYYTTPEEPQELKNAANNTMSQAFSAWESARRATADAETALQRARTDLERARNDFYDRTEDGRSETIKALENAVENARKATDDAHRAYDKAQTDLARAKADAVTAASDALERAQNNLSDAERAYERALLDKERAIEDYIKSNETRLETARKTVTDSRQQLRSAENSYAASENAYNQAAERPAPSSAAVETQWLTLERLNAQLEECVIYAPADGVVTEINARVGSAPSGILFIIEETDNYVVTANIREYSLRELKEGQRGTVSADAVPDTVYDAEVIYISPRAVSQAGNTNVEFEAKARIEGDVSELRIGMNAFLEVVTDEKRDIFAVPISSVVTDARGSFIYVYENGGTREIPVIMGLTTATHAEIEGGITTGMAVLTDPLGLLADDLPPSMFPFMR